MNQKELAATFRKLGARDPEDWARSQAEEGIPQLARFLFLRQAWRQILQEDDSSWIDASIDWANTHPDEPYAGVGHALRKLRARGATNEELTDVVRGMQAQLLFRFVTSSKIPATSSPRPEMSVGFSRKSIRRETFLIPSEGFMSRCSRQIPLAAKCGPELRTPANQEMQRTTILPRSARSDVRR